jgi:hypothetical protein
LDERPDSRRLFLSAMVLTDTPYGYMMYTHKGYAFEKDSQEVDLWIE